MRAEMLTAMHCDDHVASSAWAIDGASTVASSVSSRDASAMVLRFVFKAVVPPRDY